MVRRSRQREWATDILEGLPSLLFLALSQSGVDLKFAGWAGAALAGVVLVGFRFCRLPYNPIVLGINLHLLIITPLIMGLFYFGAYGLGKTLLAFSHRGVLVTVFVVGCALTLLSRRGFVGIAGLPDLARRAYSLVLLSASATAIAWSFMYTGAAVVAIGIPFMALFGLRRLLIARWQDRNGGGDGLMMLAAGSRSSGDPASEGA
jgi:hypothetical protein